MFFLDELTFEEFLYELVYLLLVIIEDLAVPLPTGLCYCWEFVLFFGFYLLFRMHYLIVLFYYYIYYY